MAKAFIVVGIVLISYVLACVAVAATISLILTIFVTPGWRAFFLGQMFFTYAVAIFSFLPAMCIIGMGLNRRVTSWGYYSTAGAALGFVLAFLLNGPSFRGPLLQSHHFVFLVAGYVGGWAFWLLATGAGLWNRLAEFEDRRLQKLIDADLPHKFGEWSDTDIPRRLRRACKRLALSCPVGSVSCSWIEPRQGTAP